MKEIGGGVWGQVVNAHKIDVDTLSREMRCVEREGALEGGKPVTFLGVFKPIAARRKGIIVRNSKYLAIIFKGGLIHERFLSTWSGHHTASLKKG